MEIILLYLLSVMCFWLAFIIGLHFAREEEASTPWHAELIGALLCAIVWPVFIYKARTGRKEK